MSQTDAELLAHYRDSGSETAFAELVQRHVGLVFHSALRQVRDTHFAEEVAQSAFVKLAREASQFSRDTILSAWLFQVTRNEAIDLLRREIRRKRREQIAGDMNTVNQSDTTWKEMEPLLDEAMEKLESPDRTALLLRYFENQSLREVGVRLGISEDTAQKRVTRAVEKLRTLFTQQGVRLGSTAMIVSLSANAAKSAPLGLSSSITSAAIVAAKSLVASSVTTAVTHSILMASFKKFALAILILATTGTCIYQIQKARMPVTEQISMEDLGAPFQKPAVLARRSRLKGRELAMATRSQIIAAYEEEQATLEFTNLWDKAQAGDFPSIRELLSNDKYVRRSEEPIRPFLFAFITNTSLSPIERGNAINFSSSFAIKRNFGRPYPETYPALVLCLEDSNAGVRSHAGQALELLKYDIGIMQYLPQLEAIAAKRPESRGLSNLIINIKKEPRGFFEASRLRQKND